MAQVYGVQEIKEYIRKKADQAAQKAMKDANEELRQKVKEMTDTVVDRWYGYYSPQIYDRSGNIKNYEIIDEGDGIIVDFSQQIASRQDNDAVLDLVVGAGYHGGWYSNELGGVRWRTGWGFSEWGRPAHLSPAIIDDVNTGIDKINNETTNRASELFAKYFSM